MNSPSSFFDVLFLIRSLHVGGAERQLVQMAQGLQRRGMAIGVLVFYSDGECVADLQRSQIPIFSLKKKGRWDVLPVLLRCIQILRKYRPRVLYSFLVDANIVSASVKFVLPHQRICWGIRAGMMDFSHYDFLARVNFSIMTTMARIPDRIIVNSESGKESHRRSGLPDDTMTVIENGIDLSRFFSSKEIRKARRNGLGLSEAELMIGWVGRSDPMKNIIPFIDAAKRVREIEPSARFFFFGNFPQKEILTILERAKQMGTRELIFYGGFQSDMNPTYNALDILVSSSLGEGFPNVIAEAMACGVPCVATDVGDSKRIMGDTGVLVPAGVSGELLAQGILDLRKRLSVELREVVRQRIKDSFSLERCLTKTAMLLKQLMNEGDGGD